MGKIPPDLLFFYEVAIIILIILSAFFSGTETALVSSNRIKIDALASKGNRRARRAGAILDNMETAMGMILIGNNIANIAATAFITFIATSAYMVNERKLLIVTAIQTLLFLILCEVSPKIIARSFSERFLMFFSFPVKVLMLFFSPLIKASLAVSEKLKNLINVESSGDTLPVTREEIDTLFRIGQKEGVIDADNLFYISEMFSFKETTAYEVMTPTIDIESIEINSSIKDLVYLIDRTKFSRIPVFSERVDNIVGYVFYRDIVRAGKTGSIADIFLKAHFIPDTKNIFELYLEMVENTLPMVFGVNEFGAVIGMVTHEDIAEEIVGEIDTSDHADETPIIKIGEKKYLLDGSLDFDYFLRYFSSKIEKKDFETIAGFMTFHMGKIPKKGDSMKMGRFRFIVDEATDRSIEKVLLMVNVKK